jgi:hypothetical protein
VTWGADASKSAVRSSCAWHQFGSPWGNASQWLTRPGDRHLVVTRGTDASKSAMRSSCAWHQFGSRWSNASHWLMQTGDRHSVVTRGTDASKSAMRSSCAWHQFGSRWSNASHWLMQTGDRHSAVPGGRMLARCGAFVMCLAPIREPMLMQSCQAADGGASNASTVWRQVATAIGGYGWGARIVCCQIVAIRCQAVVRRE